MKRPCLLVMLFAYYFIGFSQVIENVDYNLAGNVINVFYDIDDYFPAEKYDIKVEFVDDKGQVITPRTLFGDHGITTGGQGKKIVWSVFLVLSMPISVSSAVMSVLQWCLVMMIRW